MSRAEEFLDLYKRLEALVANSYGARSEGGSVAKLGKRAEFRFLRTELDYIRDVRNILSHRPKIDDQYVVEPSEAMVQLLKKVIDMVEHPAIAENIMIKRDAVLCCTKEDLIIPVMRLMNENAFAHVPILEGGRVSGIFSDSTFIRCTLSGEYKIDENTRFSEIEKELAPEKQTGEVFLFTHRQTGIDELSDLFEKYRETGQKVGMIFVTEHGKETEKLLGIITAWDVAAAY